MALYEKIQNEPLEFPAEVNMSSGLKRLLTAMMEKEPAKRITLEQVHRPSRHSRQELACHMQGLFLSFEIRPNPVHPTIGWLHLSLRGVHLDASKQASFEIVRF